MPVYKLRRDASELAVVPFGTVVKTDLTEDLILLTCTRFCKRLKEEVALLRMRLCNR